MSASSHSVRPLRLVFMGTPAFAVPALEALLEAGHEVLAVYSQPPSRAGRGRALRPSPVHAAARKRNIPVVTPRSLKQAAAQKAFVRHFTEAGGEIAVVAAYGLILPQPVLEAPPLGCLNIHASLLPRWRGAAPIQRAIMAGDTQTGITIMQMDEGLDTGPMCLSEAVEIPADMTAGRLHDVLAAMGGRLITRALALAAGDGLACTPQPETGATYASKIEKSEARIDWTAPAQTVVNQIRGLSPFPGAWFELEYGGKTERIKLLLAEPCPGAGRPGQILDASLTIACGEGAVCPLMLQRAGRKPMDRERFLRGFALTPSVTRLR